MRTYTGPTMGGGVATVACPDWCVVDHAYWDDRADDMYCMSEQISIMPPGSPEPLSRGHMNLHPQLAARLSVHATNPKPCEAVVLVELSQDVADGVDLDVPGVDALLAQLDAYRAKLAGLRETLAAIHKERRR